MFLVAVKKRLLRIIEGRLSIASDATDAVVEASSDDTPWKQQQQ